MAAANPPTPPEAKETAATLTEGRTEQQPRVSSAETAVELCEGNTEEQPRANSAEAAVKLCEVRTGASSAASCSTSSSSSRSEPGPSTRRPSTRRPDGSSGEAGPADLESLEKSLRRESVVDSSEVAHLTLPSTPLKDSLCNDVKLNLELASEKLSKLAPEYPREHFCS